MLTCGSLMLAVSSGVAASIIMLFLCGLIVAWWLEESRWQLSSRVSVGVTLLAMSLFYLEWKYQIGGGKENGAHDPIALALLLLSLTIVKLLQKKSDRDWLLLYLISFLQVLLAARSQLDASLAIFFVLYLFLAVSSLLTFEVKRAARRAPSLKNSNECVGANINGRSFAVTKRVPLLALCLLMLTLALALPLFYIAPRFNGNAFAQANRGRANIAGISDQIALGQTGRIQQSDEIVMRVQLGETNRLPNAKLRWRGVAFDEFNGHGWRRSSVEFEEAPTLGHGFYAFSTTRNLQGLMTQTFFLEPSDASMLFAAARPIALQGSLPYVLVDSEGAIETREHPSERVSYRIYSDVEQLSAERLRADNVNYTAEAVRYLQLPRALDPRIAALANETIKRSGAQNRYDAAQSIEHYLQTNYRYSLDMRAGGADPLADFLFNVREGHCEYYAAAMAAMLRTQGIAARVVNGFQAGDYNEVSDAYVVRQRNAHSWVEVLFPATNSWVTFDPTPFNESAGNSTNTAGLSNRLAKYMDAAELFWIQNVISYDRQAQRSLANKVRTKFEKYAQAFSVGAEQTRKALSDFWLRRSGSGAGDNHASLYLILTLVALCCISLLIFFALHARGIKLRHGVRLRKAVGANSSDVLFYQRMTEALERQGLRRHAHQTPLEFAESTRIDEVLSVTRFYHSVRFGARSLSAVEQAEIESCLQKLETI